MREKRSAEDAGWAPGEAAGGGFLEDETVAGRSGRRRRACGAMVRVNERDDSLRGNTSLYFAMGVTVDIAPGLR